MTDIASLAFQIDSRQLKQGQRDLEQFGATGDKVSRNMPAIGASATRAALAFAGLGSAALAAGRALQSAQAYVTMTNSLRAIGMTGDQAAAALDQVAAVAQRTRSPLDATAQLYQRVSIAGRDLGASSSDVLRFTENISLALAQTGGSAASASGALLQLSQAMSGGTVRAEEFNSILEGAFPIAQAAANAIDGAAGSVGRLRNMVIEGEISSKEFFDAIISQSDALEAAFANTVPTIGQAITVLGDSFTVLSGKMDASLGVSSAIAQGILVLAENMDRVATYAAVAAVAVGVTYGGAAAIAAARTLTLSSALVALRGAIVRTGVGALVIAAGELTYRFMGLVGATGSFGEALGLLRDVAVETFGRIATGFAIIPQAIASGASQMAAIFAGKLAGMLQAFQDFTNGVVSGLNGALGTALPYVSGLADGLRGIETDMLHAGGSAREAIGDLTASLTAPMASIAALKSAVTASASELDEFSGSAGGVSGALEDIGGSGGGGGGSADAAASGIDAVGEAAGRALTQAEGFNLAMQEAALTAEDMGRRKADILIGGIDGVSDAFGAFVADGLRDFDGFVDSVLGSFKSMLAEMIAVAARNQIMIGMGLGPVGGAAGVGSMGGALGGIGGAFGSGLTSVLGGFTSGGLSGGIGAIGTALSGATSGLAGLATAAGAVALPLAAAYGAFKFFAGSTKELDAGIRLNIQGNELLAESYRTVQRSRFFGLSKSTSTSADPLTDTGLSDAYAAIYEGAEQAAWAVGLSSKALAGYRAEIELSTKGMSEAEGQAAAMNALLQAQNGLAGAYFDALGAGSRSLIRDGEEIGAAMQRIGASVTTATDLLQGLGHRIDLLGQAGARAGTRFINTLGGLDQAGAAVSAYVQAIYTDGEQARMLISGLQGGFRDLGMNMPQSEAEFRAIVDRQLAAGQLQNAAALIRLGPLFDEWVNLREAAAQRETEAARAAAQERGSIWERILELEGRSADLLAYRREQELRGTTAANQALLRYQFSLEDQAARQEELRAAADAASAAIQKMIDAIQPEQFATRFAYENALGLASNGLASSRTTSTGVTIAAVPTATNVNADLAAELQALRAEVRSFKDEQRALVMNGNSDLRKLRIASDTDQAIGQPPVRSAS